MESPPFRLPCGWCGDNGVRPVVGCLPEMVRPSQRGHLRDANSRWWWARRWHAIYAANQKPAPREAANPRGRFLVGVRVHPREIATGRALPCGRTPTRCS